MKLLQQCLLASATMFLSIASLFVAKGCLVEDQVQTFLLDAQETFDRAAPDLLASTANMKAASIELVGAAKEQRSYYKATGKAAAILMINGARLVEHIDADEQRIMPKADLVLTRTSKLLATTDDQVKALGEETQASLNKLQGTLDGATAVMASTQKSADDVDVLLNTQVKDTLANAAKASQHLDGGMGHLEEAAASIDAALKPLREAKGKVKLVLGWLAGLVKVNIR